MQELNQKPADREPAEGMKDQTNSRESIPPETDGDPESNHKGISVNLGRHSRQMNILTWSFLTLAMVSGIYLAIETKGDARSAAQLVEVFERIAPVVRDLQEQVFQMDVAAQQDPAQAEALRQQADRLKAEADQQWSEMGAAWNAQPLRVQQLAFRQFSRPNHDLFVEVMGRKPRSLKMPTFFLVGFAIYLAAFYFYAAYKARRLAQSRDEQSRPRLERPPPNFGRRLLVTQTIIICLLLFMFSLGGWNLGSVGFDTAMAIPWAVLIGFGVYFLFIFVLEIFLRRVGLHTMVEDHNLRVHAKLWPRQPAQKMMARVGICCLNPFTEEILYRGILVYQFAEHGTGLPVALALGLIVNLANHAYQGRLALFTHVPFYGLVVAMLFSPLGLWGAIGFHIAGDTVPFIMLRKDLQAYRNRHRFRSGNG